MLFLETMKLIVHLTTISQLNKLKGRNIPGVILRLGQEKMWWDWQTKIGILNIVLPGEVANRLCMDVCPPVCMFV